MTVRAEVRRWALVGLAVGLLIVGGGGARGGSVSPAAGPVLALTGPCPGATAPTAPAGSVAVVGGPLSDDFVAGTTVEYSYFLEEAIVAASTGAVRDELCLHETAEATANASGDFAFASVLAPPDCAIGRDACLDDLGAFGRIALTLASPVPSGYSTSVAGGPENFSIDLVYDLAAAVIEPGGPTVTVAPGAPTSFDASAAMANGSSTPLDPTFAWTLSGDGWTFATPVDGATATVVAAPDASLGTLEVVASAAVPGAILSTPPAAVTLVAQPTSIEEGGLNRTTVDLGAGISVRLEAVGAAGYAYSASIAPGLGLGPVAAGCAVSSAARGDVDVNCSATIAYPSAGIAQPTARLTNGYSTGVWEFPSVTVDAGPALSIAPSSPVGYAGASVPIVVVAANGSGVRPYAKACLAIAGEAVDCLASPGPSWRFHPTFDLPGTYSTLAWAVDGDGSNGSVSFPITIVDPIAVGPIVVGTGNLSADTPLTASAAISGGALPVRYWWNVSDAAGSVLAGTTYEDGTVSAGIVAPTAGPITVTLTVVDALGSVAESERLLTIGPAAAVSIAALEPPPASPVVAGTAFDVAWEAVDRSGAPVVGFATPAEVELSRDGVPVDGWVNASGLGPLPALGNGTYGLPGGGWIEGSASLSITVRSAGLLAVALGGTGLPVAPEPLAVDVAPDLAHLRLSAPVFATAGARTNSTFWHVEDRYGNPAVGAFVTVRLRYGGESVTAVVGAHPAPGGGVGVWINYSAPGSAGGNLTVLDPAGSVLLGPIRIPAAAVSPSISATAVTIVAAVPAGAIGIAWAGLVRRRSRAAAASRTDEGDLRRLAEGRQQTVEIVRRAGSAAVPEIEAAWRPAPAPADLSDWLASLVADGTLGATIGPDGRARFCLAPAPDARPRVTVDPEAFDRAQRRRDADGDDPAETP